MRTQDNKSAKTLILFLLVPAVPAIIGAILLILKYPSTVSEDIDVFKVVFFTAYLAGSIHMFFLGVPAFLLGKRFNAIRWWTCIIAGFVVGGLPLAIFLQSVWEVVSWGVFGAIGGLSFWLIWRYWVVPENYVKRIIP